MTIDSFIYGKSVLGESYYYVAKKKDTTLDLENMLCSIRTMVIVLFLLIDHELNKFRGRIPLGKDCRTI